MSPGVRLRPATAFPVPAAIALIACAGCVSQSRFESLQGQIDALRTQLRIAGSKAMCSPEVRSLIKLIKTECRIKTNCTPRELQILTREIEPHERFMWLMRDLPHVVVYLNESDAAAPVVPERMDRLRRLVQPPWLDWAQLLIIGHGGAGERGGDFQARQRAEKVKQLVAETDFGRWAARREADTKVPSLLALSYSFPLQAPTRRETRQLDGQADAPGALELLNRNVLLPKDMPLPEEPDDISRGVWVFLIECADEP